MSTKQSTMDFILDQLADAGDVRSRKMFGEYALYLDGKVVAFVCDDTLFVKILEGNMAIMNGISYGEAYPGSKPYYKIPNDKLEDRDWLVEAIRVTADVLPAPKKKGRAT